MFIEKIIIKNYKSFKGIFELDLNENLNIIVGDNEAGKSTILEAINIALTAQLNGKPISAELSPYLFNYEVVQEYISSVRNNHPIAPPVVRIEVYLKMQDELAEYRGTNNLKKENVPGFYVEIKFDEDFNSEYLEYINEHRALIKTVPIEYYEAIWYSFANNQITLRSIPLNACLIDTTITKLANGADIYISRIIRELLDNKEKARLAFNHRGLKEKFAEEQSIQEINIKLQEKQGEITEKRIKLCVDFSSKTNWETTLTAHLDDIPFHFIGKGEQNTIKMKLALEGNAKEKCNVILVEEPENHLSYSNMHKLIDQISQKCFGKQLVIATHSSYVINKLGLENLILLANGTTSRLTTLNNDTQNYFKKLPGYDTLRILLSPYPILVEGPSDELIVQKAYFQKYGKLPIVDRIDIITVRGLSFKRFLEIAKTLNKSITVIRDNDGRLPEYYMESYSEVIGTSKVFIDEDIMCTTLESQIVKQNTVEKINGILETAFENTDDLLKYMRSNKTDCAMKIFESEKEINIPSYIANAI